MLTNNEGDNHATVKEIRERNPRVRRFDFLNTNVIII